MRFYKKMIAVLSIAIFTIILSGCSPKFMKDPAPIDPNGGFWDRYFVFPMSWLLDNVAEIMNGSYGFSIIVTTIIIRLIILPLMVKQLKSSKAMQQIQPELQKIKDKYKGNQQKVQEETMKLFQKNNVNPIAGCLPLIVQMPILIAFYQAIMRNGSIRTYDFLWMSLGKPDPYYILPIVAAITTYFQSKMMGTGMPQNAQMQMMIYIMPAMILFIAISLPSALSLYWVFGNLFTIIQTVLINRGNTPVPAQEVKK